MKISPVKLAYELGVLNCEFNHFSNELENFMYVLPKEFEESFKILINKFDRLRSEIILDELFEACSFEDQDNHE